MDLPKILYVDDEELNLKLFELNLQKKHTILKATNGNDGLEILRNDKEIQLIISDFRMPTMNGLEFFKEAKKICPNAFYFLLTGFHLTHEIQEALDSKLIFDYLKKPFDLNEIHEKLTKALSSS